MSALEQLTRHVNRVLSAQSRPLFLIVDAALRVVAVRGDAAHFGLATLATGDSVDECLPVLATLDASEPSTHAWRFVELPGAPVSHVHVIPVDDGWGVALLDASREHAEQQARQQAAHELLLLRDERERLLGELAEANRLKGEFIARMSHEFRTPLTSVLGYGEQLRERCADDPHATHHVGAVIRGGHYLLNLVENLLDQASLDTQTLQLNPGACDLHDLSEQVELLLRPQAEQKQLSLGWWFDGELPPRVWLDGARLTQVLINLVGNALKFTREGGVNVEFGWHDGRLHVAVSDTGPGIGDDDAQRIFEPFQQAGGAQQAKGAGLGLAISQALVRAMGGEITLDTDKRGSCFAFTIDAAVIPSAATSAGDALAGRRVLLADDDPDLLDLFSLFLKAAGCSVEQASGAEQTIQRAQAFRPDAIVLDRNLGSAHGHDVARQLRRAGYRQRIALLTAAPDSGAASEPGELFDAYWHKPIGRAQLLEGLAGLLT